ncbi:MAG: hypothetical protein ACOZAN_04095 [Patescibacteria group bacterium]
MSNQILSEVKRVLEQALGYFLLIGFLFCVTPKTLANTQVTAYLFYGKGCPHCLHEQELLKTLVKEYPQIEVKEFEIYHDSENHQILEDVANKLNLQVAGVPFLVIGDQAIPGYTEGITNLEIEQRINHCLKNSCPNSIATIIENHKKDHDNINHTVSTAPSQENQLSPLTEQETKSTESVNHRSKTIVLPLFGEIESHQLSLPVLTFVLAFLDGFNPCAMWTLLFLISLLLGMKDRKRMWILGIAFIVSSSAVYFLFLSAWLNLFLFLGFIIWVRLIIGLLAVGAGFYYLRDYWINRHGGCAVMGNQKRQRVFQQLKQITQKPQFLLALIGIIMLAVAVNMVELVCSAGLPAIYTQILSLSNLPNWQYNLYLLLYICIFMLDDLFVFFTAMITLHAVGVQTKYSRFSHLLGGFLMLIIGMLLIFKPEWLMFG